MAKPNPYSLMRRGDRGALKDFLQTHGSVVVALRDALESTATLAELAVVVWKASLSARPQTEPRGHALAAIAQHVAGQPRPESPAPQTSLPAFVFAVAYRHLGIGGDAEAGFIERALEEEPELAATQKRVSRGLAAALSAPTQPCTAFEPIWAHIEPLLK